MYGRSLLSRGLLAPQFVSTFFYIGVRFLHTCYYTTDQFLKTTTRQQPKTDVPEVCRCTAWGRCYESSTVRQTTVLLWQMQWFAFLGWVHKESAVQKRETKVQTMHINVEQYCIWDIFLSSEKNSAPNTLLGADFFLSSEKKCLIWAGAFKNDLFLPGDLPCISPLCTHLPSTKRMPIHRQ